MIRFGNISIRVRIRLPVVKFPSYDVQEKSFDSESSIEDINPVTRKARRRVIHGVKEVTGGISKAIINLQGKVRK